MPFETWTLDDALKHVRDLIAATVGADGFAENAKLVEDGDHWQEGRTWVGPRGSDAVWNGRQKERVHRQFTPVDVVGEVLRRHVQALMQREPGVEFAPLKPAAKDSAEAKRQAEESAAMRATVSAWWDRVGLWGLAGEALARARWAGRGNLRLWIAPGRLATAEDGSKTLPSNLSIDDALKIVSLSAEQPDVAYVMTDPETQERVGVFVFMRGEKQCAEVWYRDQATGDTVCRSLATGEDVAEYRIPMGGRLPIAEMEADVLITGAVRAQQHRLNFFESVLTRSVETSGFPERYTANARPNGVWLRSAPVDGPALETYTDPKSGTTWYLHAAPRTLGAGLTTDLVGIRTGAGEKETIATPSVTFRDPTDPDWIIKASMHARATILRSCHQGHVASGSNAEASGLAYQQARADFEADLGKVKGAVERMVRETIEAAIAMAEAMGAGGESFLSRYRCVVDLSVSAGPVSPEEQRVQGEAVKDGMLSRESALARRGVEDVAAEVARIDSNPVNRLEIELKRAKVIEAYIAAGLSLESAAIRAGCTPEEASAMAHDGFASPVKQ